MLPKSEKMSIPLIVGLDVDYSMLLLNVGNGADVARMPKCVIFNASVKGQHGYGRPTRPTSFARIIEVMSFVEELHDLNSEEIHERVQALCELSPRTTLNHGRSRSCLLGRVATGMDVSRRAQEAVLDQTATDKFLLYSSLFAHSTRVAVVDMTLQRLESTQ